MQLLFQCARYVFHQYFCKINIGLDSILADLVSGQENKKKKKTTFKLLSSLSFGLYTHI